MINASEHLSHALAMGYSVLWNSFSSLLYILWLDYLPFFYSFDGFLYKFWIKILCWIYVCMYICMYWNTFSRSVIFFHSLNNVFDEHVLNFNQANLNIFSLYLLILCPIFIQIFCPKLKYTIHLQQIYVYCKWGPNRFKDGKFSGLYSFCISRTAYLSNSKKLKKKKKQEKLMY